MHKQALGITLIAAALCGCSPMPPMPPMDNTAIQAASGASVMSGDGAPVTTRNWRCMPCYK